MDPERFDRLVRSLARPASRRDALAGLVAALAALGEAAAEAGGKRRAGRRKHAGKAGMGKSSNGRGLGAGKPGRPGTPPHGGPGRPPDHAPPGKPGSGEPGGRPPACSPACARFCAQVFPPGKARGQCVADAAHKTGPCYQCGPGCGGRCGKTLCGQRCVDTQTDASNCGGCGTACTAPAHAHDPICRAGRCAFTCDAGWADCNGAAGDGCETPLGTDANCATCGDACGTGEACNGGACVGTCSPKCAGKCGGASNDCGGTCDGPCDGGQTCCGQACVTLGTNANCSACGDACTGGKTCQGGSCRCPNGTTECSGGCVQTSALCGGVCSGICGANQRCCGGSCTDIGTDANCSGCGDVCPAGATCQGGGCSCGDEQPAQCPIERTPDGQPACFYQFEQSVGYCWVRPNVNLTQAQCQAADSCGEGGGGVSGGGCYKWARSSCDRIYPPWPSA